jgi:hypothetical protein
LFFKTFYSISNKIYSIVGINYTSQLNYQLSIVPYQKTVCILSLLNDSENVSNDNIKCDIRWSLLPHNSGFSIAIHILMIAGHQGMYIGKFFHEEAH